MLCRYADSSVRIQLMPVCVVRCMRTYSVQLPAVRQFHTLYYYCKNKPAILSGIVVLSLIVSMFYMI